jgi:hypothetical protein
VCPSCVVRVVGVCGCAGRAATACRFCGVLSAPASSTCTCTASPRRGPACSPVPSQLHPRPRATARSRVGPTRQVRSHRSLVPCFFPKGPQRCCCLLLLLPPAAASCCCLLLLPPAAASCCCLLLLPPAAASCCCLLLLLALPHVLAHKCSRRPLAIGSTWFFTGRPSAAWCGWCRGACGSAGR